MLTNGNPKPCINLKWQIRFRHKLYASCNRDLKDAVWFMLKSILLGLHSKQSFSAFGKYVQIMLEGTITGIHNILIMIVLAMC